MGYCRYVLEANENCNGWCGHNGFAIFSRETHSVQEGQEGEEGHEFIAVSLLSSIQQHPRDGIYIVVHDCPCLETREQHCPQS